MDREGEFQVVCYKEQVEFLKAYLGDLVTLRVGAIETVESWFDIGENSCL